MKLTTNEFGYSGPILNGLHWQAQLPTNRSTFKGFPTHLNCFATCSTNFGYHRAYLVSVADIAKIAEWCWRCSVFPSAFRSTSSVSVRSTLIIRFFAKDLERSRGFLAEILIVSVHKYCKWYSLTSIHSASDVSCLFSLWTRLYRCNSPNKPSSILNKFWSVPWRPRIWKLPSSYSCCI